MHVKCLTPCLMYGECQYTGAWIICSTEFESYRNNFYFKHNVCCKQALRNYTFVLFYYESVMMWKEHWSILLCQLYRMKYSWAPISPHLKCNLLQFFRSLVPRCIALAVHQLCTQSSSPGEWRRWSSLNVDVVGKIDLGPLSLCVCGSCEARLYEILTTMINRACLWLDHSWCPKGEIHSLWKE